MPTPESPTKMILSTVSGPASESVSLMLVLGALRARSRVRELVCLLYMGRLDQMTRLGGWPTWPCCSTRHPVWVRGGRPWRPLDGKGEAARRTTQEAGNCSQRGTRRRPVHARHSRNLLQAPAPPQPAAFAVSRVARGRGTPPRRHAGAPPASSSLPAAAPGPPRPPPRCAASEVAPAAEGRHARTFLSTVTGVFTRHSAQRRPARRDPRNPRRARGWPEETAARAPRAGAGFAPPATRGANLIGVRAFGDFVCAAGPCFLMRRACRGAPRRLGVAGCRWAMRRDCEVFCAHREPWGWAHEARDSHAPAAAFQLGIHVCSNTLIVTRPRRAMHFVLGARW